MFSGRYNYAVKITKRTASKLQKKKQAAAIDVCVYRGLHRQL
jgi:hypothetical protein